MTNNYKTIRHVHEINKLTQDMRINIPPEMNVKKNELYMFERVDEKTIKMTNVGNR